MQWGDVATWVGAIGTAAAAGIAVWLGWRAHKSEEGREVAEREARTAAGRRIYAWGSADGQRGHFSYTVFIRNATDEPVYNVKLTLLSQPSHGISIGRSLYVLAPGQTRELTGRVPWSSDVANPPLYTLIAFCDRDGVLCHRNPDGTLTTGEFQGAQFPREPYDQVG